MEWNTSKYTIFFDAELQKFSTAFTEFPKALKS